MTTIKEALGALMIAQCRSLGIALKQDNTSAAVFTAATEFLKSQKFTFDHVENSMVSGADADELLGDLPTFP